MTKDELLKLVTVLQAELDATNRQVEILSDALAESRREVAALKAVQEPVAFFYPGQGFYWAKPTKIIAPVTVDVKPLPLYTTPPAQPTPVQKRPPNCGTSYCSCIECIMPPARPAPVKVWEAEGYDALMQEMQMVKARNIRQHAEIERLKAAQLAVPDAFGTREGEHPQYIQGWNDCRAEMLKGMK